MKSTTVDLTQATPCLSGNSNLPKLWLPRHLYNRWFTETVANKLAAEAKSIQLEFDAIHHTDKKRRERLRAKLKSASEAADKEHEVLRAQLPSEWTREEIAASMNVVVRPVVAHPEPNPSKKKWKVKETDWIVDDGEPAKENEEKRLLWRTDGPQATLQCEGFCVEILDLPDNLDILHRSLRYTENPPKYNLPTLRRFVTDAVLHDDWVLKLIKQHMYLWQKDAEKPYEAMQIISLDVVDGVIDNADQSISKGYDMRQVLRTWVTSADKPRDDGRNSPKKCARSLQELLKNVPTAIGPTLGDQIDSFRRSKSKNCKDEQSKEAYTKVEQAWGTFVRQMVSFGRRKQQEAKRIANCQNDREQERLVLTVMVLALEDYCLNYNGPNKPGITNDFIKKQLDELLACRNGRPPACFPNCYAEIVETLLLHPQKKGLVLYENSGSNQMQDDAWPSLQDIKEEKKDSVVEKAIVKEHTDILKKAVEDNLTKSEQQVLRCHLYQLGTKQRKAESLGLTLKQYDRIYARAHRKLMARFKTRIHSQ